MLLEVVVDTRVLLERLEDTGGTLRGPRMGEMFAWGVRVLRYLFASMLGSVFTLFILNLRDGVPVYAPWPQATLVAAAPLHPPAPHHHHALPISSSCNLQPQQPALRHGVWQVFTDSHHEISVYGAYYDDRLRASVPIVRVFGVSSAPRNKTVLCQIWYKDYRSNPVLTTAVIASPGRGYKNKHKVQYQEYLYNCPVSKNDSLPANISLAFLPCQNSTIHLAVHHVKHQVPQVQVGVCVAAAFGQLNTTRLVEWVEMLQLLGVGEINVYNSSLQQATGRVLEHYRRQGVVVLHPAPPPIQEYTYWPRKLAVIPGFNDCVYRNMYRYNYTMIIDFDEIIVPRHHDNYTAMINAVRKHHKHLKKDPGLIVFRNAYFFLDLAKYNISVGVGKLNITSTKRNMTSGSKLNMTSVGKLNMTSAHINGTSRTSVTTLPATHHQFYRNSTMLSSVWRVAVSPAGYAVKSIFDPRTCVIAWNHYCVGRLPKTQVLNVDPQFALSHHYKNCHFDRAECRKKMNHTVVDATMLKYKTKLLGRLRKVHIR